MLEKKAIKKKRNPSTVINYKMTEKREKARWEKAKRPKIDEKQN